MTTPDWNRIADAALGSCTSVSQLADQFEVDEDEVEERLLDLNVEVCPMCGWWVDSGELIEDDHDDGDPVCDDCRPEVADR